MRLPRNGVRGWVGIIASLRRKSAISLAPAISAICVLCLVAYSDSFRFCKNFCYGAAVVKSSRGDAPANPEGSKISAEAVFDAFADIAENLEDGKDTFASEFGEHFDEETVRILEILQIESLARDGNKIRVRTKAPCRIKVSRNLKLDLEEEVSFETDSVGGNYCKVVEVRGVRIGLPALKVWGIPENLSAKKGDYGMLTLRLKLRVARWLPRIRRTITVDGTAVTVIEDAEVDGRD